MRKNNDQILVINSLRGIAATIVCFYHFVYTTVDYFDNSFVLNLFYFGQKGVQLFFIISGIVIPLSMINSNYTWYSFKKFLLKRFIRIEPPYLVAVLIGVIYLIVRNYIPSSNPVDLTPTLIELILHVGYLIPFIENANWINPVFWTLAIEFQYYIALSLLFPLLIHYKLFGRIVFYSVFIAIGFLPVSGNFFPYWAPYFLIGIVYILFKKQKISSIEMWILYGVLAPVIYINLGYVDLIIAVIALFLIHFFANAQSKITLFLGKISYSLYLLHSIIGAAFINFMSHRFTEPYQKVIVVLIGFGISVLSGYLLYKFVEKPTHNYAKKIN